MAFAFLFTYQCVVSCAGYEMFKAIFTVILESSNSFIIGFPDCQP